MADENLSAGGYAFGSLRDADLAREELEKIDTIRKSLGKYNLSQLLDLYTRMNNGNIFRTPVGLEYMRSLRAYIIKNGAREEDVPSVVTYVTYSSETVREQKQLVRDAKELHAVPADLKKTRSSLSVSVGFNVILVLMVVAMFYIALHSNSPNILNYKENILNQYSQREQELSERENAVREKERQLNMDPGDSLSGSETPVG